jgi:hypothetical protein
MIRSFVRILSCALILCLPVAATATIINPPGYAADDGSTAFSPEANAYFFEAFDPLPTIGITTSFGFYRVADPSTKITVFDAADQAAPDQIAWANFPFGGVFDVDAGVGQSLFAPGFGPVGFFLQLDVGGALLTIFSDPALNAGLDLMATFPDLATPGAYMLGVETGDGSGSLVTVYLATISGFRAIPEPMTAALVVLALGLGAGLGRRRSASAGGRR